MYFLRKIAASICVSSTSLPPAFNKIVYLCRQQLTQRLRALVIRLRTAAGRAGNQAQLVQLALRHRLIIGEAAVLEDVVDLARDHRLQLVQLRFAHQLVKGLLRRFERLLRLRRGEQIAPHEPQAAPVAPRPSAAAAAGPSAPPPSCRASA